MGRGESVPRSSSPTSCACTARRSRAGACCAPKSAPRCARSSSAGPPLSGGMSGVVRGAATRNRSVVRSVRGPSWHVLWRGFSGDSCDRAPACRMLYRRLWGLSDPSSSLRCSRSAVVGARTGGGGASAVTRAAVVAPLRLGQQRRRRDQWRDDRKLGLDQFGRDQWQRRERERLRHQSLFLPPARHRLRLLARADRVRFARHNALYRRPNRLSQTAEPALISAGLDRTARPAPAYRFWMRARTRATRDGKQGRTPDHRRVAPPAAPG